MKETKDKKRRQPPSEDSLTHLLRAARAPLRLALDTKLGEIHEDGAILIDVALGDAVSAGAKAPGTVAGAHAAAVVDEAANVVSMLRITLQQALGTLVHLGGTIGDILGDMVDSRREVRDQLVGEKDGNQGLDSVDGLADTNVSINKERVGKKQLTTSFLMEYRSFKPDR